jgi:hypothetical protein
MRLGRLDNYYIINMIWIPPLTEEGAKLVNSARLAKLPSHAAAVVESPGLLD